MSVTTTSTAGRTRYDFPIVTWSLIGLNVLVYAAIALTPEPSELYNTYGLTATNPTFLTMITSSFLHGSLLHLTMNMIFLWIFGRNLERALPVIGFLLLYVCSGVFASLTHLAIMVAFGPVMHEAADQPSLGASGAIAGILGMYAIRFFRDKVRFLDIEIHPPILLLVWLMLQVFFGVLSLYVDWPSLKSVDYWAHMGGFIFGILVAYFTHMATVARREYLLTGAEDTYKRGTLLDVVRKYEALLKCDRNDPFASAELGRTWALLGDAEQALPYYHTAIDLYLERGKGDDAITRYQEILRILPDSVPRAETLFRLAEFVDGAGKPSKAVAMLTRLCSDPKSPDCEIALLTIADMQLKHMNKPDQAAITLRRFLDSHPNSKYRQTAEQALETAKAAAENSPP